MEIMTPFSAKVDYTNSSSRRCEGHDLEIRKRPDRYQVVKLLIIKLWNGGVWNAYHRNYPNLMMSNPKPNWSLIKRRTNYEQQPVDETEPETICCFAHTAAAGAAVAFLSRLVASIIPLSRDSTPHNPFNLNWTIANGRILSGPVGSVYRW